MENFPGQSSQAVKVGRSLAERKIIERMMYLVEGDFN
jgi:hypothetical protein